MYCKKCGSEFSDGASFCPKCGEKNLFKAAKNDLSASPYQNAFPSETNNRSAATPNPVTGFVFGIVGIANNLLAWLNVMEKGYYNNRLALIFSVIGALFGIIALILILVHRKNYNNLRGVGIAGLILSIAAVVLTLIFIMEYSSAQHSSLGQLNSFLNGMDNLLS